MHRFFAELASDTTATLCAEEAAHAFRVLRLSPGDACQAIVDGHLFNAEFISLTAENALLRLNEELPSPEPSVSITLYQGLPKGDKMEWIIQKGTESGITRFVPVLFSRCVTKWEKKDEEKKLLRWQRIALEAAKQSGRAVVPEVSAPVTMKQLEIALSQYDLSLIPWEEAQGKGIPSFFQHQKNAAVVIGPEGGISENEIEHLKIAGGIPITLGPRIFRTETAGLAAAISLLTLSGDMGR